MASGTPVIASNVCGIPYQIEHEKTGLLVRPGDVEGLSNSLNALLSDEERQSILGKAARSVAREQYRADKVADSTVEVYNQILRQIPIE
jgi:glycosyltransferase involved in cell wall biosynthesis